MHTLLDGRDVEDGSSVQFMEQLKGDLEKVQKEKGVDALVASGGGRMRVTMDRYEVSRQRDIGVAVSEAQCVRALESKDWMH